MYRWLTIFVLLMVTVLANASGIQTRWGITLGNYGPLNGVDKGKVPAAVIAEGQNPSITNHYTGHYFDVGDIGQFDATKIKADQGLFDSPILFTIMADAALAQPSSPYVRANLMVNNYSSISGDQGSGYAYSKVLGSGSDFVRYIYGAKIKPQFVTPEIGWRWRGNGEDGDVNWSNIDKEIGLQLVPRTITFYKGIEAFGKPESLVNLGQIQDDAVLLNVRFTQKNAAGGLIIPLKGGGGIGLYMEGHFIYDF